MPKVCYEEKRFGQAAMDTIHLAGKIISEYTGKGLNLTLRQLYYQFVARGLIPNSDKEYKKLGNLINDARLAGHIDWYAIEDRTRYLRKNNSWDTPNQIVEACAMSFHKDRWEYSPNYVEVWVEKDALVGVLEAACQPLDTPFFSCRGYTSQTEMWNAARRVGRKVTAGKFVHIIHLGDHDPSGVDMSRDIEERVRKFLTGDVVDDYSFHFKRVALTMTQVDTYTPPPNPAKITDSRCKGYIAEHGHESWELDALEPTMLMKLIDSEVRALIDVKSWDEAEKEELEGRAKLKEVAKNM
jgi:hypothetical protein